MSIEKEIQDNIDALRRRARNGDCIADLLRWLGAHGAADRIRHDAKLNRMLADQQAAGLRSGAYKAGRRQHPTVEEQCGCRRCLR